MSRFVSACCEGQRCWCGAPAEHKVGEDVFDDDPRMAPQTVEFLDGPVTIRGAFHELTAYICHEHFVQLMGPAAIRDEDIDTSDIPEAGERFFKMAKRGMIPPE